MNLEVERQKFQDNKTNNEVLLSKFEEMINVTKGASMSDLNNLNRAFLSTIKELKKTLESTLVDNKTGNDKSLVEIKDSLSKLETKLKDIVNISENNYYAKLEEVNNRLNSELSKIKSIIPKSIDLGPVSSKVLSLTQELETLKTEINILISTAINDVKEDINEKETGETLVTKIQEVKRPWLSIEAIDGDFNTKVTKQFGGGNTTPLEVRVNGVSYGGAREVNFVGSGVAAEIINGVVTVTVAGGGNAMVDNEVVSGTGTAFTLSQTPIAGTVHLYALGQRLKLTTDYSISGVNITTVSSWSAGDITADYQI